MKLDLILENIRGQYTLGLLEESEALGEKEVLKGKLLINEATMEIRKMLVEEGVMADVRYLLESSFANIIEEFSMAELYDQAGQAGHAVAGGALGAADQIAGAAGSVHGNIANGTYGDIVPQATRMLGAVPTAAKIGAALPMDYINNPAQAYEQGYDMGTGTSAKIAAGLAGAGAAGLVASTQAGRNATAAAVAKARAAAASLRK